MAPPALLACDWGTTNVRAWALDADGRILSRRAFPFGVSQLSPEEGRRRLAAEIRPVLGAEGVPAILCGMAGSSLGWAPAPYADCPVDLDRLRRGLTHAGDRTWIVPGVRGRGFDGHSDVMRGEETQLFGWLSLYPERARGAVLVCQPGTHTKWMLVQEGRLEAFVTAMTGELFAVLRRHSVLRSDAPTDDLAAFDDGVAAAGDGGALLARLFTARARLVGSGAPPETASSYLSGLLVGADVAATPGLLGRRLDEGVIVLGDVGLCGVYARALAAQGVPAEVFDGEAAAAAGLWALRPAGVTA